MEWSCSRRLNSAQHLIIVLFLLLPALACLWPGAAAGLGNEECLECHGTRDILEMSKEDRLEMVIPTPEKEEVWKGKITLYLDYEGFQASVHRELSCLDCHNDIQELPHSQRLGLPDCGQCHDEIVKQHEKSKHARVSKRLCFECHDPHLTTPFKDLTQQERIGICQQCHKEFGHTWLPQPQLHLHYLECTVCHAAKAEKAMFFQITAKKEDGTRSALSYQELQEFARGYKGDIAKAIDITGNDHVELFEIKRFFAKLRQGGIQSPQLREQILVLQPYHNYTDEVIHIKDCTMCHVAAAPFYTEVALRIPGKNGGFHSIPLDKSVIEKMPPIASKDYYYDTVHGKNGVECIDCHADLTVLRDGEEFAVKEMGTPVCEKCHQDIMAEYKDSVHYRVSEKICFGCHDPHASVSFRELRVEERTAICTKCHEPVRSHDWLP